MTELQKDYFLSEDDILYQHPDHFHFNTDTKLLANFMKIRKNESVLDIGTNNGALLYAANKQDVKELVGVEIVEEACAVAQKNVDTFFKHPALIVNCPIQSYEGHPFDVVVSNPPYFREKETNPNIQMNLRQYGRVEKNLKLDELIFHAARLLKSNGRFYLVHRPNRFNDIMMECFKNNFRIKTIQIAYDSNNNAKTLLIEAIKEGTCDSRILSPIYI